VKDQERSSHDLIKVLPWH